MEKSFKLYKFRVNGMKIVLDSPKSDFLHSFWKSVLQSLWGTGCGVKGGCRSIAHKTRDLPELVRSILA